jgi:hypothetical protein
MLAVLAVIRGADLANGLLRAAAARRLARRLQHDLDVGRVRRQLGEAALEPGHAREPAFMRLFLSPISVDSQVVDALLLLVELLRQAEALFARLLETRRAPG